MWRCGNCGLVWDEEEAPEQCPNCSAGKAKYTKLGDKAGELVDRSRFTNSLHVQLSSLLDQLMDLAEDGIDDDLDANCVKIFERALEQADALQRSVNAELQAHVKDGRWG